MTSEFKPGQAVMVRGTIKGVWGEPGDEVVNIDVESGPYLVAVSARAVHLAPGDGPVSPRHGHHPDPLIDSQVECDRLEGLLTEAHNGLLRALDYRAATPEGLAIKADVRRVLRDTGFAGNMGESAHSLSERLPGDGEGEQLRQLTKPYTEHLRESLQDPREAAAYLRAALEDGDPEVIELAASDVAKILDCFPSAAPAPEGGDLKFCCDVCGSLTIRQKGGNEICSVCFWEDDGRFDNNGANHITLAQAKANYAEFGAVERQWIKDVRKPTPDEQVQPTKHRHGVNLDGFTDDEIKEVWGGPVALGRNAGSDDRIQQCIRQLRLAATSSALMREDFNSWADAVEAQARRVAELERRNATWEEEVVSLRKSDCENAERVHQLLAKNEELRQNLADWLPGGQHEAAQARRLEAATGLLRRLVEVEAESSGEPFDASGIVDAAAAFLAGDAPHDDGSKENDR